MSVVEAESLSRVYGEVKALSEVSFHIERGGITGLLGPNGAGKSTTMKILTGFLAPTSGSARVCGVNVLTDPVEAQRRLGYLPESAPLYDEMGVAAYLRFVAELRGLGAATRERAVERVLEDCGLTERASQRISTLSRGYRQRVGLAQALLHEPDLLILDEPTSGLDPNQMVEIRALIRRVATTRTVVLSTHVLPEVQATCDRVMILSRGELVAHGDTSTVLAQASGHALTVGFALGKVHLSEHGAVELLQGVEGVEAVELLPPRDAAVRLAVRARCDVREAVFALAVQRGHSLIELAPADRDLEGVFRRLTR